ncbi:hypothetical protein FVP74_10835 [Microbacterium saccharophilum]|uniref:Phosphoribosyltransferase domain-containing protein n=1 Tax=Microbacterium saccharophilum TaxID=1213358 RepID=A0A5C8HVK4_9MICO|nr:phosphoribosyltransferase family protein [Microbacterium saccharophilum]TXK09023.1 hypothetical protein FVP74_10835 [Microbacterium saccharophilum]GEP47821.1 phosphoribosyltransferase [Microbacterium saccharophilum]
MALFEDRAAAGRDLARALDAWRADDALVVGLPRGGVVVAAEVARVLGLPLTAVAVRKLGAPRHAEFAVGAIADGVRVVHPDADDWATPAQLAAVEQEERAELRRRQALYTVPGRDPAGRTVIVVDDGVATGATATSACRSLRAHGAARIVLAVPVAPAAWRPEPGLADDYVCPHPQQHLWAVGQYYDDFRQARDAEVVALLARDLRAD